jgi:hypothetical protein
MHDPFRSYEQALNLSEQDIVTVAAPNKQPAGNRPGPAKAHEHPVHEAGKPTAGGSSTVKPGHTKGVVTKPTGKNKNRLH